jgi:predicted transcriptional regulator
LLEIQPISALIRENVPSKKLRRSSMEMKIDILSSISAGFAKPTQIMYKSNLSWTALQVALKELIQAELIQEEENKNRVIYRLTPKGVSVLQNYKNLLLQFFPVRKEITTQ